MSPGFAVWIYWRNMAFLMHIFGYCQFSLQQTKRQCQRVWTVDGALCMCSHVEPKRKLLGLCRPRFKKYIKRPFCWRWCPTFDPLVIQHQLKPQKASPQPVASDDPSLSETLPSPCHTLSVITFPFLLTLALMLLCLNQLHPRPFVCCTHLHPFNPSVTHQCLVWTAEVCREDASAPLRGVECLVSLHLLRSLHP